MPIHEKKFFRLIIALLLVFFILAIFVSIRFLKGQIDLATNPSSTQKKSDQGSLSSSYEKILPRFE